MAVIKTLLVLVSIALLRADAQSMQIVVKSF